MPTWAAAGQVGDFSDVDPEDVPSIYDEATQGVPKKGPYLMEVGSLRAGVTGSGSAEPGSAKLVVRVNISEPAGTKKAIYNGYQIYRHLVLNDMFAGRINAALHALMANSAAFAGDKNAKKRAAVIKAFWAGKATLDGKPDDPGGANITKIGTWVVPEKMLIGANTKLGKNLDGDPALDITAFMPYTDAPKGVAADDAEDVDEEPEESEEEENTLGDEEQEGDAEVDARAEELDGFTLVKLKTVAKGLGGKLAEYKALEKEDLIEYILDREFPPEDDTEPDEEEAEEEEAEESEEEDEEAEESDGLDEMSRAELKAFNTEEELGVKVLKSMSDDDLREAIRAVRDTQVPEADEEEEAEEEPEPPTKPARRGATAKAASPARPAARRRGAAKADDEPPF